MINRTVLLRITFFSGLMLLLLLGGILAGIVVTKGGSMAGGGKESTFHRLLREYDFRNKRILETELPLSRLQEFEELDRELDRLEKKAEGVESWLSVLKRRRLLVTDGGSRFTEAYRKSSWRAAAAFPYSEPIAAVAAAALIHDSAITRETESKLRETALLLTDPRFASMRLSLYVLLGDLKNPETAMTSMLAGAGLLPDAGMEQIVVDLLILQILAGDIPGVAVDIQSALSAFPSPDLIRLAAEYHYDFGEPLRSAELFSLLPDEAALSRQADALWLSGYADNARAIWEMLVDNRALYNLALSSPTAEESAMLLERLVEQGGPEDLSRRFGLIRYSRLFDASRALAVLDNRPGRNEAPDGPAKALIDLEILRRRSETGETARVIAETWLLLERYPREEALYEWSAWYFGLQRSYNESALLMKTARRHGFSGRWMHLYEALRHIHDGNVDEAEALLSAIAGENTSEIFSWVVAANLGRILESRHAPARALENYEKALAAVIGTSPVEDREITASRIQVRVALCLKSLGRLEESRRALEYALDLNSNNLNARLELSRLE